MDCLEKFFSTARRMVCGLSATAALLAGGQSALAADMDLRVHYYPSLVIMLPVFVAEELELFEKHGLNVELVGLSGGQVAIAALASNSVDIIHHTPSFALTYNNKNPAQAVTQIVTDFGPPIYRFVGRKDLVESCADAEKPYPAPMACLRGKKVGVIALGADNYYVVRSLLAAGGVSEAELEIVATGSTAGTVNMLRTQQIDFGILSEPGGTQIVDVFDVAKDLINLRDHALMNPWMGEAAFAFTTAIEENPEKYRAFAGAIAEAVQFINSPENRDAIITIFKEYSPLDDEVISALMERYSAEFSSQNNCEAFENIRKWLIESGQIEASNETTCEQFMLTNAQ